MEPSVYVFKFPDGEAGGKHHYVPVADLPALAVADDSHPAPTVPADLGRFSAAMEVVEIMQIAD